MSSFSDTDPDAAVDPGSLAALRHALIAGEIPELHDETWSRMIGHATAEPSAEPSGHGVDRPAAYPVDPNDLVPPHADQDPSIPPEHSGTPGPYSHAPPHVDSGQHDPLHPGDNAWGSGQGHDSGSTEFTHCDHDSLSHGPNRGPGEVDPGSSGGHEHST